MKKLLSAEEASNPTLFRSIQQAIRPLMTSEGSAAVSAAAGAVIDVQPTALPPFPRKRNTRAAVTVTASSSADAPAAAEDDDQSSSFGIGPLAAGDADFE